MQGTDKGIIIKNTPFSDTSLISMIYTEKNGLSSFLAKGGRRQKSQFRGKLESGFLVSFVYYRRHAAEMGVLKEVEPIETYPEIRENITLIDGMYSILWVLEHSPPEKKIFILAQEILKRLNTEGRIEILPYFFMKFFKIEGIYPNLFRCHVCGEKSVSCFSTRAGGTMCRKHCSREDLPLGEWFDLLKFIVRGYLPELNDTNEKGFRNMMKVIIEYGEFHSGDWFHRLKEILPSSIRP